MALRTIAGFMIAANAIDGSKIAADAVDASKIAAGAVGSSEIAGGAVGSGALASGAVGSAALAAGAVDAAALAPTALAGRGIHDPVRACTDVALPTYTGSGTATLTAAGLGQLSIDGQALNVNDRVLVTKQTAGLAKDNMIYKVQTAGDVSTAWVLVRDNDSDTAIELPLGSLVYVAGGAKNGQTTYRLQQNAPTLGTDPLTWDLDEEGLTPGRYEGVGNGSADTFNFGQKGALGVVVFVGGIVQPQNVYTLGADGGGMSQIVFTAGNIPPNGASVDAEFFTRA